jgi:hypothetical protein
MGSKSTAIIFVFNPLARRLAVHMVLVNRTRTLVVLTNIELPTYLKNCLLLLSNAVTLGVGYQ